jgi:excisionase family DNA binding protein
MTDDLSLSLKHSLSSRAKERLITVKQAAQRLGVSPSTVYRMRRRSGKFRFVVRGWRVFVDAEDLERFLAPRTPAVAFPESCIRPTASDEPPQAPEQGQSIVYGSQPELAELKPAAATAGDRHPKYGAQRELRWPDQWPPLRVSFFW